jgi:hypothetical protein
MKQQLEQRLKQLITEFESGQKTLAEQETNLTNLRNTLLRISGAIQVIREELHKESKKESNDRGGSEVFPKPEPITE